ncbi:peptidoglycan recognition protein family protein [Desulfosporosinus metallidurans]|uniref:Phage lysin, N-acetylmuramoyl-L-alanine amidase n=1 Tax=Desulfosporosinus metallidurans TaxID=1888891 RepID=A0A1Q8QPI3_9FIRM|nr:peptidoglycan recognition family protein [Desulfosporosinus metallidurans]OLN29263.1 Phage lysin, N-acetylmuramoyl-L-alanine amidase [Desulfosporosinus metallidurans]
MDWQKIVIHHTASPTEVRRSGKIVPVDAAMIREWHRTRGWSDIGYHFVIMPDGRCEDGRPLYRSGAHCNVGHRNFIGIGICLVGNFSETEVPDTQLVGLVNKVVQLLAAFKLGVGDVELHRDVPGAATECPGRYFPEDAFKKELEESIS